MNKTLDQNGRHSGSMAATITARRHRYILSHLSAGNEILVKDIVQALKVSEATVRRDLQSLEDAGHLVRIHGGAEPVTKSAILPLVDRKSTMQAEKAAIARIAAPLISGMGTVYVGGGTTMLAFAEQIAAAPPALCVTNMIDTALILGRSGLCDVVLLGGHFDPDLRVMKGPAMSEQLTRYRFDAVISSTNALHPSDGFLDHDEGSSFNRRQLCTLTQRHIVLADHTKFGRKSRYRTMPLGAVTDLVTDRPPERAYVEALEAGGVRLHTAEIG
ncbi:MAG: DeoR/GlpR family DNA-binding transcription regulator [Hyphomonas sp.]|nr:DeoR/GlpR family DNA-binding transcription regulator [Hyphomonas sp.]